jgi:hypothetical protein
VRISAVIQVQGFCVAQRCGLKYLALDYNDGATGSTKCSWISLQADAMTLVARIVAADSRCSLRRAVILDRMIAVSPSRTDQFSNLASPAGPDSGGPTFAFALNGGRWSIRRLTLHLPGSARNVPGNDRWRLS